MDHVQKVVYRTIGVLAVNIYALKDVKLMNAIQKMDIVLVNQTRISAHVDLVFKTRDTPCMSFTISIMVILRYGAEVQ